MDVVNVNFSSSTTPELLLRNLDHYCEYRRTPSGLALSPIQVQFTYYYLNILQVLHLFSNRGW